MAEGTEKFKEGWGGVTIAKEFKKTRELIRLTPEVDIKSVEVLETPTMTQAERIKNMQNARAKRLGLQPRE